MKSPRGLAALFVVALAFAYAIVRYNIIKGVSWSEFPLYISNKAIALSALALIALSYALGSLAYFFPGAFKNALPARKLFGLAGFGLAAIHSVISLLIFNASYYPKFFAESGKLNLIGELSLLFGIVAFALFCIVALASLPSIASSLGEAKWRSLQRVGYLGLFAVAGHVFVMGYKGWMDIAGWPGGLLPISLVAFIIILAALLIKSAAVLFKR